MADGPQPKGLILGVDLGGTSIRTIIADPGGQIISRAHRATHAREGPQAVVEAIFEMAQENAAAAGITLDQLKGAGVGAPGPLDPDEGMIFSAPNLPGWINVPLRSLVEQRLGVKTFLGNDAKVAALAELHFGAGRGVQNFIYITVSTGIGGGIIIDGKLYTGARGIAGEVGHMTIDVNGPLCGCGNNGCWEALASGTALAKRARQKIEQGARTSILQHAGGAVEKVTAEAVAAAARQGDSVARQVIADVGYYLGVGLANLVNLFNPELILIGGGLSHIGEPLLKPAREVAAKKAFRVAFESVRFARPRMGDDAGTLGAVVLVIRGVEKT